jgi:cation:H+ antiporter
VLLYFGGDALVWGSCSLAKRVGISALAIGLTVVAFGTSMPEMVVSLDAARSGATDISLGNVVGSNIANIALILGLAACFRALRCETKIARQDAPIMIGISLLLLLFLADGLVSGLEGTVLFISLLGFTGFTFWQSRRNLQDEQVFAEESQLPVYSPQRSVALILVGLVMLIGGGHLVVEGAVAIADVLGLSQAVIGLTIVAVGTSLPELSTSVVAAIRNQGDIAIGNIVGSNIFNILGILGFTAALYPLQMGAIAWFDLWLMVIVAVVFAALMFSRNGISRSNGAVLLLFYGLYTVWLLST